MSAKAWQERDDNVPGQIYAFTIKGIRQKGTNFVLVKIGLSRNAQKRLEQLRRSQPCGDLVMFTVPVDVERMLDCEKYLHNKYAKYHVEISGSKEWFAFNNGGLRSVAKDFQNLSEFQYRIYRLKEKEYKGQQQRKIPGISMVRPKLNRISVRSLPNTPVSLRLNPVFIVCGIFSALIIAALF